MSGGCLVTSNTLTNLMPPVSSLRPQVGVLQLFASLLEATVVFISRYFRAPIG